MRAINKNNFPEFAVDYLDGNLSEKEKESLFSFLERNPECKAEFDLLTEGDSVRIRKDKVDFSFKSKLHKQVKSVGNINELNYLETAVASMEGDLTDSETKDFSSFRKENAFLEKEISLVEKIKLHPEEIHFEKKELLYKKALVVSFYPALRWSAAAAVLISAWFFISDENTTYEPRLSQNQIATLDSSSSFEWAIPFAEKMATSTNVAPKTNRKTTIQRESKESLATTETPQESISVEAFKMEIFQATAKEISKEDEFVEAPQMAFNTISGKKNNVVEKEKTNSLLHPMEWIRMGTKLVARVSKREIKLLEHYDNSGDLVAYTIVSGENKIHRNVKN